LLAGYKQGRVAEMNDELWKAKKIVDSTLHPGSLSRYGWYKEMLIMSRYGAPGIFTLPNVKFCSFELGCYSGYADSWSWGKLRTMPILSTVANEK
jgi:hypothetical protein